MTDDDREGAALTEAILTRTGAEVRTCHSAAAALDLLRQWRPDVLLCNSDMPGEEGYSLIGKVRALAAESGGKTPAIALTAYLRPQDRVRSLMAGLNVYVAKPVDPGELTGIIASVVSQPLSGRERI